MEGTIRSLEYFTPPELILEYIFVSDGNEDTREVALRAISEKVRVLALPEREGLIRAKMKGVAMAKAPVLIFLEAHCRASQHWLEPLLQRLKLFPKALVMPTLDGIPADDWQGYIKASPGAYWRYEWNMNLVQISNESYQDGPEPYESP